MILNELFSKIKKRPLKLAYLPSVVKLNLDREDGDARRASLKNPKNSKGEDHSLAVDALQEPVL